MWTPSKQKTPMSVRLKNMSCSSGGWQGSESGERSWGVNTCGLILPSSKIVWEDFTCIVHTHSQCCMGGHFHICVFVA